MVEDLGMRLKANPLYQALVVLQGGVWPGRGAGAGKRLAMLTLSTH